MKTDIGSENVVPPANETYVYIPDIKQAIQDTFRDTPGFKQMDWTYRRDTGEFVMNDVFAKSTREIAFIQPPAAYYLIGQALMKLPLFCVLNETAFDRLVSMITMKAVSIRKNRIQRQADEARRKAEKEEKETVVA